MFKQGETYTTGTGQVLNVHAQKDCAGQPCCIHDPSNHHMVTWRTHWREDRGIMERLCTHGIGHPDPDGLRNKMFTWFSIHGCDGCCAQPKEKNAQTN